MAKSDSADTAVAEPTATAPKPDKAMWIVEFTMPDGTTKVRSSPIPAGEVLESFRRKLARDKASPVFGRRVTNITKA